MTDEQAKAINELVRVAQVTAATARGLWLCSKAGSSAEAALHDIEKRLDDAVDAVQATLTTKPDTARSGDAATVH